MSTESVVETHRVRRCTREPTYRLDVTVSPAGSTDSTRLSALQTRVAEAYERLDAARQTRAQEHQSVFEFTESDLTADLPDRVLTYLRSINDERWGAHFRDIVYNGETDDGVPPERFNERVGQHVIPVPGDDITLTPDEITINLPVGVVTLNPTEPVTLPDRIDDDFAFISPMDDSEYTVTLTSPLQQSHETTTATSADIPDDVLRSAQRIRDAPDGYTAETLTAVADALRSHYSLRNTLDAMFMISKARPAASVSLDVTKQPLIDAICDALDLTAVNVPGLNDTLLTWDDQRVALARSLADDVSIDSDAYIHLVGRILGYPEECVEFFFETDRQGAPPAAYMVETAAHLTIQGEFTPVNRFHFELAPYVAPRTKDAVWAAVDDGGWYEQQLLRLDDEYGIDAGERLLTGYWEKKLDDPPNIARSPS